MNTLSLTALSIITGYIIALSMLCIIMLTVVALLIMPPPNIDEKTVL
jgi:hypothetical protein